MRALPVVDLGQETPLNLQGDSEKQAVNQKGISKRWLFASIVIALAGASLIGMSMVIAMKGMRSAISRPQIVSLGYGTAKSKQPEGSRKTDKILRSETTVSAKQDYLAPAQITTATGVAIKNRQFVHLSTSLAQRTGVYANNIPKFNANKLLNPQDDATQTAELSMPAEVSDADVSIIRLDLTDMNIPDLTRAWSDEEVNILVKKEYDYWERDPNFFSQRTDLLKSLSIIQGSENFNFSYPDGNSNPFQSLDVQVVPENVSKLHRSTATQISNMFEERNIIYHKGVPFEDIIRSFGVTDKKLSEIITALGGTQRIASLADGHYVRALFAPLGTKPEGKPLVRVMVLGERGIEAIAAANDRGFFVSVPPPVISSDLHSDPFNNPSEEETGEGGEGARLYESLYETLAKNDLPRSFADELVKIFGYEIDFQRRVAAGDTIEIFYSQDEDNSTDPELLFSSITIGSDRRASFRFQTKDGTVEYYDPEGKSLKKFLLRKPVGESVMRSGFGMRRHPILKYSRLHAGVDWAGKIGTPIYAAGSGVIIKAGKSSGYGNRIEIQHANGYMTSYSHQSRFAAGIEPGVKVKQGQLIGYIGNTGLSTGPHLHYEVKINGHFVDPMTIKVPRTQELSGSLLDDFMRQRTEIIGQIKKTGIASLEYAQSGSN